MCLVNDINIYNQSNLGMNITSPRRIFRKGTQARKRYNEEEERFRVTRYFSNSSNSQNIEKSADKAKSTFSTVKQTYKNRKVQYHRSAHNKTEEFSDFPIKLNEFLNVGHIQYKVIPFLTERPNYLIKYKKTMKLRE